MKRLVFLVLCSGLIFSAKAQTLTSSGNWDNSAIWSGSNIGDNISEDVSFDNNLGVVTVRNGFNYTVGSVQQNNGNTLTINSTGQLNVGSSSDPKDYSVGNTGVINVDGTLIVWGKLSPGNSLTMNVTGALIIKGDLDMGNNATLTISGDVQIDGSLKGGNGTAVEVQSGGNVTIGQDIDVGNGSSLTGTGSMSYAGSCSDSGSGFCTGGPLPVELVYFIREHLDDKVLLKWRTASEENNDFFTIERSTDGKTYEAIGTVQGAGTSFSAINYQFHDTDPLFGQSYYRLKQTDYDGNYEYFGPVSVYFTQVDISKVSVYPNPARVGASIHILTGADDKESIDLKIFNLQGHIIHKSKLSGYASSIPLRDNVRSGVYMVQVTVGNVQKTARLIVQ